MHNQFVEVLETSLYLFEELYKENVDWEINNPLEEVTSKVLFKMDKELEKPFLALSIYSILYQRTLSFEDGIFKEKNKEYLAIKVKESIQKLQYVKNLSE